MALRKTYQHEVTFIEGSDPEGMHQVIDPRVHDQEEVHDNLHELLVSVLRVSLKCSTAQPNERMEIGDVAAELQKAQDVLRVPRRRNRVRRPQTHHR